MNELESMKEDLNNIRYLIHQKSIDTTTDSVSFGGVGGRVMGRSFECISLKYLKKVALKKVRKMRQAMAENVVSQSIVDERANDTKGAK